MAAAPAPANTTCTAPMSFATSSSAFKSAAPEMIAVPCWSSWKTGIASVSRSFSDVETVRRADVLEVDAADGRLEQLAEPDHVVRLLRADLQVEHIDVGERLEQDPFALHHGLPRERPDVAEPEHGGPVRHHRYQVALRRVGVGLLRPPRDLTARLRHPRGVSEGQVALVLEGLGRRDLDLPRATLRMVVEGLLAAYRHRGHKSFSVKDLCYWFKAGLSRRRK